MSASVARSACAATAPTSRRRAPRRNVGPSPARPSRRESRGGSAAAPAAFRRGVEAVGRDGAGRLVRSSCSIAPRQRACCVQCVRPARRPRARGRGGSTARSGRSGWRLVDAREPARHALRLVNACTGPTRPCPRPETSANAGARPGARPASCAPHVDGSPSSCQMSSVHRRSVCCMCSAGDTPCCGGPCTRRPPTVFMFFCRTAASIICTNTARRSRSCPARSRWRGGWRRR